MKFSVRKLKLSVLNWLISTFDKKIHLYRDPTLSSVVALRINIYIQWMIQTILELKQRKSALARTKMNAKSKTDKICLVMGNGPSLKILNIHKIAQLKSEKDLEIFTVNYGILVDEILSLDPDYILLSDNQTNPISIDERSIKLWKILRTSSQIRIISPITWHERYVELQECQNGTCLHFTDSSLEGVSNSISPLKARGYSSMSAYKALAYAVHLDYRKIFCIGIDNSSFKAIEVSSTNKLIQFSHHISSNYLKPTDVSNNYPRGMADYLADYASLFQSLRASFGKSNIVNLSTKSEVDAFPKISREDNYSDLVFWD